MEIKIYVYPGFSYAFARGKQDMRVDTIDVGAENGKSGMNYLKFILKASFPDARSRRKCVYA